MTEVRRPIGRALAAPRRGLGAFVHGLGYAFRGAKLVYLEQSGLTLYWLAPIVVTVLALIGSLVAVFAYEGELTSMIWTPGDDWDPDVASFLGDVLEALVVIVLLAAALVATLLVSSIVAAPFNGRLAEILDERVTGTPAPSFAVGRALRDVGRVVVIETIFFAVNAVLLLVSLFVPALSPVTGVVGLAFGSLYFGVSYLETPQATRGRTLRDRLGLVGDHTMEILGFGSGVGLFLFVPFVNLLFMPAAVAGGVLLHASLADGNTAAPR